MSTRARSAYLIQPQDPEAAHDGSATPSATDPSHAVTSAPSAAASEAVSPERSKIPVRIGRKRARVEASLSPPSKQSAATAQAVRGQEPSDTPAEAAPVQQDAAEQSLGRANFLALIGAGKIVSR